MTTHTTTTADLTPAQQSLYWEAVGCGADHEDAMEAAETNGYTTSPSHVLPSPAAWEAARHAAFAAAQARAAARRPHR